MSDNSKNIGSESELEDYDDSDLDMAKVNINEKEKNNDKIEEKDDDFDAINLLTPNEDIDSIKMFDSTVEVIGYIDSIEAPRSVGDQKQYRFFKFYINNGSGRRIQVVAWNDEVERIEQQITTNIIVDLDGVQARTPKVAMYNNGNVPFELHVRGNTVLTILGKYNPSNIVNNNPQEIEFKDILNTSERVILKGFLKSNFGAIYNNKLNKKIGCGAITDGNYKIEIHILNFDLNKYLQKKFKRGDKIQVVGNVQNTADPPYLIVTCIEDIKKLEGRMSLGQLVKGIQTPKKRKLDDNLLQQGQNKAASSTSKFLKKNN
ncbi:uncharacterized protein [Temnothorax nylanderi]